MNFCVENTVPSRTIRCYANNKPWVTPELKALLNEKKRAFSLGDKGKLHTKGAQDENQGVQRHLQEKDGGATTAEQRKGGLERTEDEAPHQETSNG